MPLDFKTCGSEYQGLLAPSVPKYKSFFMKNQNWCTNTLLEEYEDAKYICIFYEDVGIIKEEWIIDEDTDN